MNRFEKEMNEFIKNLFKIDKESNPKFEAELSIDQVCRLLEDPDYETFSPEMKRFIQNQQVLTEYKLKSQSN